MSEIGFVRQFMHRHIMYIGFSCDGKAIQQGVVIWPQGILWNGRLFKQTWIWRFSPLQCDVVPLQRRHKRGCLPSSSTSSPWPVVNQADSFLHCPCLESLSDIKSRLPAASIVKEMPDPIKHGRVKNLLRPVGQVVEDVLVCPFRVFQKEETGFTNCLFHVSGR